MPAFGDDSRNINAWVPIAVLLIFLLSIAGIAYVTIQTVSFFVPTKSASGALTSLWRVLGFSLASGILAFATIEFAKRISPLRAWFNMFMYERVFMKDLWSPTSKGSSSDELELRSLYERRSELYYSSRSEELAAQIASQFYERHLTSGEAARTESSQQAGEDAAGSTGGEPTGGDDVRSRTVRLQFERRLDTFQSEVSYRWTLLLRVLAAVSASLVGGVVALETNSRASVVFGAFILGLVIGGPFSWVIRDLTRIIESRAKA